MADAYTQASSVASDTTAYQALSYFALRQQLIADPFADVRATEQTHNGAAVTFFQYADLSVASSSLTETTDPDSVAMSDSTVTLTLAEYGNAVKLSAKIRGTTLLPLLSDAFNVIGYNAGLSVNALAVNALVGGTNVYYSNVSSAAVATSEATLQPGDTVDTNQIRYAVAQLRNAHVMPRDGSAFAGLIHPFISADLRATTGVAAWRDPHTYSSPEGIWNAETGMYEGVRWIEDSSAPLLAAAAGSSSGDVYKTVIFGQQALAKAVSLAPGFGEQPSVFEGPITDKLRRFIPVGWFHMVAYGRFREASLRRLESTTAVS